MGTTVTHPKIAFIGAGNMASSIIGGLLEQDYPVSQLSAADPFAESLQRLAEAAPGISVGSDNQAAINGADLVLLAVKPQVMAAVADDIAGTVQRSGAVVVSIAAGVTIDSLQQRLGADTSIIRCMPNTPALLRSGATGLFANAHCSADQRNAAATVLGAVGSLYWVDSEALLDAVTALSGSGPAYFFLFMEAMADAGEKLGLDAQTSARLAIETGLGASLMAARGATDLVELRQQVTSPGGTTEAAIHSFENNQLRRLVDEAMLAASDRAKVMAEEMG